MTILPMQHHATAAKDYGADTKPVHYTAGGGLFSMLWPWLQVLQCDGGSVGRSRLDWQYTP